jgi:hypothetical protein
VAHQDEETACVLFVGDLSAIICLRGAGKVTVQDASVWIETVSALALETIDVEHPVAFAEY